MINTDALVPVLVESDLPNNPNFAYPQNVTLILTYYQLNR